MPISTAEDNMNVQLKDITVTARDGRVSHLDQVYIRGSHVRFFIVPDMLRYVDSPDNCIAVASIPVSDHQY
jgi:small nuclear ribonucleoprotein D3